MRRRRKLSSAMAAPAREVTLQASRRSCRAAKPEQTYEYTSMCSLLLQHLPDLPHLVPQLAKENQLGSTGWPLSDLQQGLEFIQKLSTPPECAL